jgi:murein DD-endopeptidase MepM/ murein hydrolase activator NlpD
MGARHVVYGTVVAFACGLVGGIAADALAGPRAPHAAVLASHDPVQSTGTQTGNTALALAALDRKIADLDTEEQSNKNELGAIGAQIGDVHVRLLAQGRAFYRLTRAGMLPVGGGFDELVRHAMRVERARRAVGNDVDLERRLRAREVELSRALERVARDRESLATQRTAMDAARIAMEDEQRRQSAFDSAFQSSSGASDYIAVYGAMGTSPDEPAHAGFQAARGRLLFPVVGRAEYRNAQREGTDGPGLEIHAALGTSVRAVFAGRVAFADRYGPYGRIVIIDHGDHYYTVSGNLASVDVKIGQDIAAGERVGTIGDEGQGPMLYFEVRHGSQTVPPRPWLGL